MKWIPRNFRCYQDVLLLQLGILSLLSRQSPAGHISPNVSNSVGVPISRWMFSAPDLPPVSAATLFRECKSRVSWCTLVKPGVGGCKRCPRVPAGVSKCTRVYRGCERVWASVSWCQWIQTGVCWLKAGVRGVRRAHVGVRRCKLVQSGVGG